MSKTIRYIKEGQTLFQKKFSQLVNTHSSWQVWSDFVEMTAIAISNRLERRKQVMDDREARYMAITNNYSKRDQAIFPELVAILVNSLQEEPEQDFLGELFMAMELSNHWKGQFFTPYSLCRAMAQINCDSETIAAEIQKKGYISVNDPTCGAGATLIGARNHLQSLGYGSSQAFFIGQDIDYVAGLMCYIQLSLLGCAGYVVIANTLTNPAVGPLLRPIQQEGQDFWFMPMTYVEPVWTIRMLRECRPKQPDTPNHETPTETHRESERHEAPKPTPAPVQETSITATETGQLTLF